MHVDGIVRIQTVESADESLVHLCIVAFECRAVTLRAARRLGDCLIVCLNGDASVRRLKGPDRPLQSEGDRAEVLAALDCVDAVEVFDDDTPLVVLERLRPDVFVKGGDYAVVDLPEAATLAHWGGQAVVVPYLAGRSSSRLIEEARHVPS